MIFSSLINQILVLNMALIDRLFQLISTTLRIRIWFKRLDLQGAITTYICTIHTLVQVSSHPQHYVWHLQEILQNYPGGTCTCDQWELSVVAMHGPGEQFWGELQ